MANLNRFLLFISGLIMFIVGMGANFECDLKKIIAISTLRQLVESYSYLHGRL